MSVDGIPCATRHEPSSPKRSGGTTDSSRRRRSCRKLLHYYLRTRRPVALNDAWTLVERCVNQVWPVELADLDLARSLIERHAGLGARDLVHLACCLRRKPRKLMTFDRGLEAAWAARGR